MSEQKTQNALILEYLKQPGNSLTVLTALSAFHCYALSQRCGELRRAGHPIVRKMIKLPSGKHVASYSMEV